MPKYKIVASKSQKKYSLIVSADSENEAKEKVHKENYSILSVSEFQEESKIEGNKFIFQVEMNGDIKNGIILGEDIFKVYIKLKDELGYRVIFLYPEGDEAHNSAEKKQKIMDQLIYGYDMQEKTIKLKEQKQQSEEHFYIKKELDDTYKLIETVLKKLESIIQDHEVYHITQEMSEKLEKIHESLVHIKGSTNLAKLKEIGELALLKIGQIELETLEETKNKESRELLESTNILLKKIGSKQQFIESNKDIKKIFLDFFRPVWDSFSFKNIFSSEKKEKKEKNMIDTESYNFLKTVLLLEKYNEKLSENTKEMKYQKVLFFNPFAHSDFKEKHLLKRKVIEQNISILKAKKTGSIGSYTSLKKGSLKILESLLITADFLKGLNFLILFLYTFLFSVFWFLEAFNIKILTFQPKSILWFFFLMVIFCLLRSIRNIGLFLIVFVFFWFFSIFLYVNF